jgi:ferric-dicitrate binding protein FerR (iron transport regulator)
MTEIERAKQARRSLEVVCRKLQRPTVDSLDTSAQDLNAALRYLEELEASLRSAGPAPVRSPALAAEMSAIRREIAKASALLSAAGRFFAGWARLMGGPEEEGAATYTSRGTPGPVLAVDRGKVVLHG